MNKKSFLLGFLSGAVTLFVILVVIAFARGNNGGDESPIHYLESPVSYENKTEADFQVFQVLAPDAALAREASDGGRLFLGNIVLLLGTDFYSDQIVTVKNPQRVGTYSYTTKGDMPKTVPVIETN